MMLAMMIRMMISTWAMSCGPIRSFPLRYFSGGSSPPYSDITSSSYSAAPLIAASRPRNWSGMYGYIPGAITPVVPATILMFSG